MAQGQADGGGGAGHAQFLADAALLRFDRLDADSAMLGYLLGRFPFRSELQYLHLGWAEWICALEFFFGLPA